MEKREVAEALACLEQEPLKFYYFKDRYALMLLSAVVGKGVAIKTLKGSGWGRLLSRPPVQEILQRAGSQVLTDSMLDAF